MHISVSLCYLAKIGYIDILNKKRGWRRRRLVHYRWKHNAVSKWNMCIMASEITGNTTICSFISTLLVLMKGIDQWIPLVESVFCGFTTQRTTNVESFSMSWRHHMPLQVILTKIYVHSISFLRNVMKQVHIVVCFHLEMNPTLALIYYLGSYMHVSNNLFGNPNGSYNSIENILMQTKAKYFEYYNKQYININFPLDINTSGIIRLMK